MNNTVLVIMLLLLIAPYLFMHSVPLYFRIRCLRHRQAPHDDDVK